MAYFKANAEISKCPATLIKPFFLKTDSQLRRDYEKLKELYSNSNDEKKKRIEPLLIKYRMGIEGEEKVAYELDSSFLPIIVLNDIRLEHNNLSAQIDFVVLTRKKTYFIECKNLSGDIEVTDNGSFVRRSLSHGQVKREGMYNPVSQVKRHLSLFKESRLAQKGKISAYLFNNSTFPPQNW